MIKKIGIGLSLYTLMIVANIGAVNEKLIDFAVNQDLLQEYQRNNEMPYEQAAAEMLDFVKSLMDPHVEKYCYEGKSKNPAVMMFKRYIDLVALYAVFFGKSAVSLPLLSPDHLEYIMTDAMEELPENIDEEQVLAIVTKMQEQIEKFMASMEKLATTIGVEQLIDWDKWQEENEELAQEQK